MSTNPRTPNPSSSTESSELDEACPQPPSQDIFPTPTTNIRNTAGGLPTPLKLFKSKREASTPSENGNGHLRDMKRGPPGDLPNVGSLRVDWDRQRLSKQRSQHYGEAFAQREATNFPKERIQKGSVIIAEIKINCTVGELSP